MRGLSPGWAVASSASAYNPADTLCGDAMRLCRYDDNRLGLVRGETVHDVSAALNLLPTVRWPVPPGDLLIQNLAKLRPEIEKLAANAPGKPVSAVKLLSPVANPTKIMGAPINY